MIQYYPHFLWHSRQNSNMRIIFFYIRQYNKKKLKFMLSERLKNSIKDYPDFPKKGIVFKDISPIIADPELFSDLIDKIKSYTF